MAWPPRINEALTSWRGRVDLEMHKDLSDTGWRVRQRRRSKSGIAGGVVAADFNPPARWANTTTKVMDTSYERPVIDLRWARGTRASGRAAHQPSSPDGRRGHPSLGSGPIEVRAEDRSFAPGTRRGRQQPNSDRTHDPHPDGHRRVMQDEVPDPETAQPPCGPTQSRLTRAAPRRTERKELCRRSRPRGVTSALPTCSSLPDGEGPAYRVRIQQPQSVFDGDIDGFIALRHSLAQNLSRKLLKQRSNCWRRPRPHQST